ncbi:10648_t:CDS:2 [Paraglomus brasilianum]|uniref:10648_t:CDS:1 n=1 Tax=Paraglomus brasilianum TaxID=144538 RepID=A0A9N9A361_9GLOM|nr:10648_t:CDS:2 [Paraglomus brasilianum]
MSNSVKENINLKDRSHLSAIKEEYESIPTIPALDLLVGDVVEVLMKATTLALVVCLLASLYAAVCSFLVRNSLFWVLFSVGSVAFWIYSLRRLWNVAQLTSVINEALKGAIVTSVGHVILQNQEVMEKFHPYGSSVMDYFQFVGLGTCIAAPCFLVLDKILSAYARENFRRQALLCDERAKARRAFSDTIEFIKERKHDFLNTASTLLCQNTQMALETIEQLAPSNFLSGSHEQLTACSIPVPTASIDAVHTSLKAIEYISTHIESLSALLYATPSGIPLSDVRTCFDIGQMVQNIGDATAGGAAVAQVELIIYHVDYAFYHLNVIGDESALRYSCMYILKRVMDQIQPGSSIELGLHVQTSNYGELLPVKNKPIRSHDKFNCTFEICHAINPSVTETSSSSPAIALANNMLSSLGATLITETCDRKKRYSISLEMEAGPPSDYPLVDEDTRKRNSYSVMSGEPSIEELIKFSQRLRGLRVALYATSKSPFAKHLTSCLTTWGTDISHHPVGGEEDFETPRSETGQSDSRSNSRSASSVPNTIALSSTVKGDKVDEIRARNAQVPTFIIIDDDVEALRQWLTSQKDSQSHRTGPAMNNNRLSRTKHPMHVPNLSQPNTAIIHFTSLSNYKLVKDMIQTVFSPTDSRSYPLPQVLVIPKPAGPRRFLTALHTALNKVVVDPAFMPIATSPMSPGHPGYTSDAEHNKDGTEQPTNTYFSSSAAAMSTSTPSVGRSPGSGSSSPRTGPGGGVLIIPKNAKPIGAVFVKGVEKETPLRVENLQGSGMTLSEPSSPVTGGSTKSVSGPKTAPIPLNSPVLQSPSNGVTGSRSKPLPKPREPASIPINVLIVEDNPINQNIIKTFLKKLKIRYETANNGQEAVDKWRNGNFHIVLMDIQLPVMDGIQATREIRRLEQLQNIGVLDAIPCSSPATSPNYEMRAPVIIVALTASSSRQDKENALAAGCNDFLTKPVSLIWLKQKIQEWGCMQALIDYPAWSKWKKDQERKENERILKEQQQRQRALEQQQARLKERDKEFELWDVERMVENMEELVHRALQNSSGGL